MKNTIILLLIILLSTSLSFAQSRAERKELLKEIKGLSRNLEQFKAMRDKDADLSKDIVGEKASIASKKSQLDSTFQIINRRDESIAAYEEQLRKLKGDIGEVNASRQGREAYDCSYSVQIGAYKKTDLTQYMDQNPNFGVEKGGDGFNRYTLGFFDNYFEAKYFSEYLNNNGSQTYVAGYYKGKRIPDLRDMTECTF